LDEVAQDQKVEREWNRFLEKELPALVQEIHRQFGM
jgi:hypothetical protein